MRQALVEGGLVTESESIHGLESHTYGTKLNIEVDSRDATLADPQDKNRVVRGSSKSGHTLDECLLEEENLIPGHKGVGGTALEVSLENSPLEHRSKTTQIIHKSVG